MKWYFALNEAGTKGDMALHTKIAVVSARTHTNLLPTLLYSGENNQFVDWLRKNDVEIIPTRLPYLRVISDLAKEGRYTVDTVGHWLRTSVCLIETNDEFVLYSDVDVFFRRSLDLIGVTPAYFAAAPEFDMGCWNYFNAGVMVVNVPGLLRDYREFEVYLIEEIKTKTYEFHDQIAYNTFYRRRWNRLPVDLNWKPYWGVDTNARLVHFHGPKLGAIEAIIDGNWDWTTDHGRQVGSLFLAHINSYRSIVSELLNCSDGLPQRDAQHIANISQKLATFDGSRHVADVDLDFTKFHMFPET